MNKLEYTFLNIMASSAIAIMFYVFTAIILWYVDGLVLNNEPAGVMALMLYFIVPFVTIQALKLEEL